VLRIDSPNAESVQLRGTTPQGKGKALVFQSPRGEHSLRVDRVLGVRTAATTDLRRVPPAAGQKGYAMGVWLDGGAPLLLVDLLETLKFQGRS
jgi:hypothetical protein